MSEARPRMEQSDEDQGTDETSQDETGSAATPYGVAAKITDNGGMDPRCPRRLRDYPTEYCPLAVMRIRAIRGSPKEPTEQEEAGMPGCSFFALHQSSCYCWFKFARDYMRPDMSHMEIAHLLCLSTDTVRGLEETAFLRAQNSELVEDLYDQHGTERILDDQPEDCPVHPVKLGRRR